MSSAVFPIKKPARPLRRSVPSQQLDRQARDLARDLDPGLSVEDAEEAGPRRGAPPLEQLQPAMALRAHAPQHRTDLRIGEPRAMAQRVDGGSRGEGVQHVELALAEPGHRQRRLRELAVEGAVADLRIGLGRLARHAEQRDARPGAPGQREGLAPRRSRIDVTRRNDEEQAFEPHRLYCGPHPTITRIRRAGGLRTLTNVIFPYPTQAEALKRAAGRYTRTRLSPLIAAVFRR
jgi:hypothetical protein